MLKFKTITMILLATFALSPFIAAHAQTRYVSDNLMTYLRGGPTDNHRIAGTIRAGEKVELLAVNNSTKYGQIRDSRGRTAWILLSDLSTQPSLKERVPGLEQQIKQLTDRLSNIDKSWNERTAEMQHKIAGSDGVIGELQQENQALKTQLAEANKKINDMSLQLNDKQRSIIQQWFMYGGGVAGAGLFLGLILPHIIPRKKKDRWMN